MASTLVFHPSYRVLDSNGNPVSGAQIQFFEAGTSTPKVVYSDSGLSSSLGSVVYTRSDGFPVASEGSSTTVLIYTGEDPYKVTILRSDDTQLFSADNVIGAPSITAPEAAAPFVPVITTGSPVTLDADDRGVLYSAQSNTITFPAATTLGDGWFVHIRNGGASGTVTLTVPSGLSYQGASVTSLALRVGQGISIACDGTAYRAYSDTYSDVAAFTSGAISGLTSLGTNTASIVQYADVTENNSPGNPAANIARVYAFDDSGVTKLAYRDSDSNVTIVRGATAAVMEAATDPLYFVTPNVQYRHPTHPKAGGQFNGTGSPAFASGDFGMGAITDNGTGNYTLALDTAFANTAYWCNTWGRYSATRLFGLHGSDGDTKTTSSFQVRSSQADGGASPSDTSEGAINFWGDYA